MTHNTNYKHLIDKLLQEYKKKPVDILGINDGNGEYKYLKSMSDTYLRTIRDVDRLFYMKNKEVKVLEIGSYLGLISIALKKLGYDIQALDIPEFHKSKSLDSLYTENGIKYHGINLIENKLPFDSNSFDIIVICEVIEHFNFNPLPILGEMNRVLKTGGYIYIGMPNIARARNRLKLLLGQSINHPIQYLFDQLDKEQNMIAGIHWREYTMNETVELINKMGFETVKKLFFPNMDSDMREEPIKTIIKKVINLIPSLRPTFIVIGKKYTGITYDFLK